MKVVAVIGASQDPRKFGNKAVRAFRYRGYEVVPVNPICAAANDTIEGLSTYASVLDVAGAVDLATLYVPHPRWASVSCRRSPRNTSANFG